MEIFAIELKLRVVIKSILHFNSDLGKYCGVLQKYFPVKIKKYYSDFDLASFDSFKIT